MRPASSQFPMVAATVAVDMTPAIGCGEAAPWRLPRSRLMIVVAWSPLT
jgi:hypothetical protein